MPVKRSKKLGIVLRRQQVADLYLQGYTQMAIAERLGLKQPMICTDLQAIRAEWRASAVRDFDMTREVELRKLDRIERESWAAWERSQKPSQSADIEGEGTVPSRKKIKNQYGDPRFLGQVNQCIVSRRALLGLDAAHNPPEAAADAGITLEIRRERVVALFSTLRDRQRIAGIGEALGSLQSGDVCPGGEPGELAPGPAPSLPG